MHIFIHTCIHTCHHRQVAVAGRGHADALVATTPGLPRTPATAGAARRPPSWPSLPSPQDNLTYMHTYRAYTYLSEGPRERPAVAGGERRVRVRKGSCQHASFASVSEREKRKQARAGCRGRGGGAQAVARKTGRALGFRLGSRVAKSQTHAQYVKKCPWRHTDPCGWRSRHPRHTGWGFRRL